MIQDKEKRTGAGSDESYAKVFICLGQDLRKCLICEQAFSRQESFEHSKFPCQPPASTAN
jgi:hypothetical protein